MITRRKILITLSILFLISSFPVSLIAREFWNFSDNMAVALPSLLIGMGLGFLISSFLVPVNKKKKNNEETITPTESTQE